MQDSADVIVVGAGLAGLNAARHLQRAGASVLVLEAREQVGGRTLSEHRDGRTFELGGEWTGSGHRRMLDLARELGLTVEPAGQLGAPVLWRMPDDESVGRLPPSSCLPDLVRVLWSAGRLSRGLDPEAPWASPGADQLDARSLADWLEEKRVSASSKWLIDNLVGALTSAPTDRLSLLHVLWWFARGGGPLAILRTTFESRIREGTAELSRRLALRLGANVRTASPVVAVEQGERGVRAETEDGGKFSSRRAVIAISTPELPRMHFDPPLPDNLIALDGLRIDPGTKVAAVLPPDRVPRHRVVVGRRSLWGAWRSGQQVTGFAAPPESGLPEPDLVADLADAFSVDPSEMRSIRVKRWGDEDRIPGCDVAFAPGELTCHGPVLRARHGALSFAGAERSSWPNNMEGALESGEFAARETLTYL